MKTYNKTHLPESITYKEQVYKRDSNATDAHRNGEVLSGRYHILVKVLQRNLRGREDNHGKPYKPTEWVYSTELGAMRMALPAKIIDTRPGAVKELKRIRTWGYGV